jgi:hypothetical protein
MPAATPATSTGFQVVAQFNNDSFTATTAIADNDIWAVGWTSPNGTFEPVAVHFNGKSWSAVPTPTLCKGGLLANTILNTGDERSFRVFLRHGSFGCVLPSTRWKNALY